MALARIKEWADGDTLTDTDLEAALDRIHDNAHTLISPLTGNLDFDGKQAISMVIESGTSNPGAELNEGRLFYRSDVNAPVFYDGTNFSGTGLTISYLTNKSGVALAAGDVVILDTSNASSVTTTTTASVTNQPMVALETIANDAVGLFQTLGMVSTLAVTSATSVGDYLSTSTTVKKAVPSSTFSDGAFAQALTSTVGAGTVSAIMSGPVKITADLPKGTLDGGAISNGTDTVNDIDFTAVECRDDGDTVNIKVGAMTKQLDVEWAAGTNAGGLAAADDPIGGANNLICWVIAKANGSSGDFFFSTSSSPSLPTGYSVKRQVGWFRWDGSTIEQFTQIGTGRVRLHRYDDPIQDVNDATITSNTAETATLTVPPNTLAHVRIGVNNTTSTGSVYGLVRPVGAADTTANIDEASVGMDSAGHTDPDTSGADMVQVNSSRQCQYMASEAAGTTTVKINTLGFTIYL